MKTYIFRVLLLFIYVNATFSEEIGVDVEDVENDEAMQEILHLQQQEAEEQRNILLEEESLKKEAANIERTTLEKEQQDDLNSRKSKSSTKESTGTERAGRSRPGSSSSLKTARTGGIEMDEKKNRDERIRSSGGDMGEESKFFGQTSMNPKGTKSREKVSELKKMGAGSIAAEIEKKLNPELLAKHAENTAKRDEEAEEAQARLDRHKIAYKHLRPVTQILYAYNKVPCDYYSILAIGRTAGGEEVKLAYRRVAMDVHPDKNRHPDAKIAFDCLQEAYEVLSSPVKRSSYDTSLEKKQKRRWINRAKAVKNLFHNARSLMRAKIHLTELEEFKTLCRNIENGIKGFIEKIIHAPTLADKALWIRDLVADNKSRFIFAVIFFAAVS